MSALRGWKGQAAFAGVLASLILGAAVLVLGGTAAVAEIASQAKRYRDYKSLQAGAGKADSLSAAYARIRKDLRVLREALPGPNSGAQVLDRLVQRAKACSLSIAGITALDEIPFPAYRELPYEVQVAGAFKDVVRYLRDLETEGMALQVRSFAARAESMNKSRIQAELGISAFVPGAAAIAGKPAAAAEPRPGTTR
jgi:Tfp pilus assembly protein PilO